jgi:hypothetical protein
VTGASALPIKNITLEYGTSKRSIVDEVTRVKPEFGTGTSINTSYIWEMKKTGSIPPGTGIWYRWKFTDDNGRNYTTPRQTAVFEDVRFSWEVEKDENMDIYWHDQENTMILDLVSGLDDRLSRIDLDVIIPTERKIKVLL